MVYFFRRICVATISPSRLLCCYPACRPNQPVFSQCPSWEGKLSPTCFLASKYWACSLFTKHQQWPRLERQNKIWAPIISFQAEYGTVSLRPSAPPPRVPFLFDVLFTRSSPREPSTKTKVGGGGRNKGWRRQYFWPVFDLYYTVNSGSVRKWVWKWLGTPLWKVTARKKASSTTSEVQSDSCILWNRFFWCYQTKAVFFHSYCQNVQHADIGVLDFARKKLYWQC